MPGCDARYQPSHEEPRQCGIAVREMMNVGITFEYARARHLQPEPLEARILALPGEQ